MRTLVWFRGKDLRIADHAPLRAAIDGGEVVPLFVLDPYFFAPTRAQELPHRIQYLLESLRALQATIAHLGSRLVVVEGTCLDEVPRLAALWKVDRVVAHRWVEPFARERDRRVTAALTAIGVPFTLFEGETLAAPGTLRTGGGTPFAVYTPFARAFARQVVVSAPLPAPRSLPPLPAGVRTASVAIPTCAELGVAENAALTPGGERAARGRLKLFLDGGDDYHNARDRMDVAGTSRLSQDLKFGTLSVRTAWTTAEAAWRARAGEAGEALRRFHLELLWREFCHSTLWDRPGLLAAPFQPAWVGFPWRPDAPGWQAWVNGTTGYPVVDAAARQLLGEGYVHNRARMIAASLLTKHLLLC